MKDRIILITSSILLQLSSVIGGIIITRSYSKMDLGTYQQGVLLFSILAVIASIGAPKAIYYFGKINSNLKQTINHIVLLIIISCIFFSGVLSISWKFICDLFSNQNLYHFLIYIIIMLCLTAINYILQPIAILTEKVIMVGYINISTSLLQILFIGVMCYLQKPLTYLYSVLILFVFIKSLYVFYMIKKYVKGSWEGFDRKLTIDICKYSFPLLLSIITLIFARRIDGFIISSFSDPITMAVYSRGALEIPIGGIIIYNIANLLMPEFVKFHKRHQHYKISETLYTEIKRISIIVLPVFFTFLLIGKDFIVFLYTEEYIKSVPVFIIYLFILPVQLYSFDTILQAMNKTSKVFYISIISAVSNVIVSIILFFMIGITGPAVGTVLSLLITNMLCLYYINKDMRTNFKKWLPWKFLFKAIIIGTVWVGAFTPLSYIIKSAPVFLRIIILGTPVFIIQIVAFWKLDMIMPKDKNMIMNKFNSLTGRFK